MNFFDQQAVKRRQSLILLACFILAMLGMAVIIHVVIAGLSSLLERGSSFSEPSRPALALIGLVWLTIIAGGFFRYLDVKGGGAVLARRFGAVRASDRSRFDREKLLLNVVAEVAIASSTPQPDVYVLRNESSINAFVLGAEDSRHVVVVTQGALDAFDRDELQAVIAHEFGHIRNGDLPLNMRLLIAMGGLMAIDEVGRLLVGDPPADQEDRVLLHPGVMVGYLLRAIGSIGVLAGQLIRSAFSRQREYLADAVAAQFTRHPFALAAALDIIRQHHDEPALHTPHVQELAHLCFQSGPTLKWYRRLLSSHPSIQSRIDAIDPHFAVKLRKLRQSQAKTDDSSAREQGGGRSPSVVSAGSFETEAASPERIIARDVNATELSDRVLLLLPDEGSCLAILFALFVSDDAFKRREYYSALSFGFNERFAESVREVVKLIPDELRKDQLSIIEHATGVLRDSLQHENRQRILLKLEGLLGVRGDYDLMTYATLQLIRRKLGVEFPLIESVVDERSPQVHARRAKAFDSMGSEFALLLSLMVESSGASPAIMDAEFERVLKCYTQTRYPRRTANETGIIRELEAAFQTLYVQPKPIRLAFVQHCLEIVQHDGYVARAERALLDLFAASLGCEELAAA
ncbi:MAG: M48 family metalloprotease [Granulosicoccus sp.]|nr:M48 family metalloprotease [Granulosicoccus sp.]